MSIATEIQRLQTAKEDIKTSIENKGVTVSPTATLDEYSYYVGQIIVSGGDDNLAPFLEDSLTAITASMLQGIITLKPYAFAYANNLKKAELPNGLTGISTNCFYSCSKLESVTIPSTVTTIGYNAFYYCSNLTSITVLATTPPTLESTSFIGTTCLIYVPSESVEAYKAASVWSDYADRIQAIPN